MVHTHFLLGGIVMFIWMVQHAHASVGCFYFIFISLKYNFVASDYNKNTFLASVIGLRLYLPLYGRSKRRNNRCFHLRLLPPFWKWTADSSFWNRGLILLCNLDTDWLISWAHTPNSLPYLEKRVTLSERYRFILLSAVHLRCSIKFSRSFRKFFVL